LLLPVATRVSKLFFVLASLMNVDPMYQYSLGFFINIFKKSLKAVEGKLEKNARNERKQFFIRKFTRMLYKNVCRSLFEKDKLLFSFLMCLKIMDELNDLDPVEERFLMTGPVSIDFDRPNPTGNNGWLLNKAWASILEVSRTLKDF
jgi:dynein heavy chain